MLPEAAQAPQKEGYNPKVEQLTHMKHKGPDDLNAKEMESKGEKVGEVGVDGSRSEKN